MNIPIFNTPLSSRLCSGVLFMLTVSFCWLMAAELGANQTTTIRVRDQVEIEGPDVLLGQIATIEGGDVQQVQFLKDLVLGKAPLPGNSRQFDRQQLMMRLKQHQIDLAAVILEAPPQIEVTRSHIKIQQAELEKIISNFVFEHAPQEHRTVRIHQIQAPQSVILSKGQITYKVTGPRNRPLMGRCPIAIDFSVDGHVRKKVWAMATIEILGPVVVTRKPLGRFKPIREDDIEVQTLDLANLPTNVLSDPAEVLGKRTKRAIGPQTPLRADIIELPFLVRRGDMVVIVAESESIKITTLGQVKKKGRLGERIPVVNLDSKRILYARVVDANTVKVDF